MQTQNASIKTVIVTGANGNLGTATVTKLLAAGYRVIAVAEKDNHLAFAKENPAFEFYSVNLASEQETSSFIQGIIEKHGQVHGALLLVGGFAMGNIEETTGEDIHKMFTLNFETAYYVARPLLAHMKQHGYGRLVFIGAKPALKPGQGKGVVAYALTKGLLFGLADIINADASGTNVVACVVAPGTIDTAPNRESMPGAHFEDWVKPEQIADVLEFICSEKGLPLRESVYKVYNNA